LLGVALGPEPVGFHAGHYGGPAIESIGISRITFDSRIVRCACARHNELAIRAVPS